jgi:hypothetical protein
MTGIHRTLRTYRFTDKDPICGEVQTVVQDVGLFKNLKHVAELANVHPSTVKNLFHGGTRRPQNATIMAILTSLGYKREIVKARDLDVEKELEFARAWNKKERERVAAAREKMPKLAKKKKRA